MTEHKVKKEREEQTRTWIRAVIKGKMNMEAVSWQQQLRLERLKRANKNNF